MAATTPHPDDFGPRGDRIPPLDFKGLLLGAGLTAGLTIAGLTALQPKYGQGTGPRSNTPTARSEVAVVKKSPQVVLTQLEDTSTPSHPLGYSVSVSKLTAAVFIGRSTKPEDAIEIDKNTELRIGKSDASLIEILAKSPAGADASLLIDVTDTGNAVVDDANARPSYTVDSWTITPVDVDVGGAAGTFYVLAKPLVRS